jgi:hypothetical protein
LNTLAQTLRRLAMLSTINGFDLLLIITIVVMGFKIYNLNRECESYVGQIIQISWDLQKEIQANVMWEAAWDDSKLYEPAFKPASEDYKCKCNFCSDLDPWLSECNAFNQEPPF